MDNHGAVSLQGLDHFFAFQKSLRLFLERVDFLYLLVKLGYFRTKEAVPPPLVIYFSSNYSMPSNGDNCPKAQDQAGKNNELVAAWPPVFVRGAAED